MTILKRHILLQLLSAIMVIVIVTAGVTYYRAYRAMIAARQYVSDVASLQIGTSGSHEFAKIRSKYKRFSKINPNCNSDDCIAKFQFDNGWPGGIHLAHRATLYSVLTLSQGSITSSAIGTTCYGGNGGEFVAHLWESLPNPALTVPFREGRTISSDKIATISFNLTPAASAEQKARAYAFHEGFLDRFGACNDATDMH